MKNGHLYALLLCSLLVACTGDPTKGGIFWSESKARARQADMMQSLQGKTQQVSQAEERVSSLRSRLSTVQSQLARARQAAAVEGKNSDVDPECVRLQQQIDELKREIRAQAAQ